MVRSPLYPVSHTLKNNNTTQYKADTRLVRAFNKHKWYIINHIPSSVIFQFECLQSLFFIFFFFFFFFLFLFLFLFNHLLLLFLFNHLLLLFFLHFSTLLLYLFFLFFFNTLLHLSFYHKLFHAVLVQALQIRLSHFRILSIIYIFIVLCI